MGHNLGLVLGHGAFGVIGVLRVSGRFAAVAVAPEVGDHHGELLGEEGSHLVPHDVALGVAVEKQQGRTAATDYQVDLGTAGGDPTLLEAFKHGAHSFVS